MNYNTDFISKAIKTKFGSIHEMRHLGPGPTVVFLHGLASSTKTWTRLVSFLPEDLDICLVDLLGHGESSKPRINYTLESQLSIIDDLVKEEGMRNFCLFGHSYGGWVAASYAKQNSIEGLVLEDSGGLKGFYDEIIGTVPRERYNMEMIGKAKELGADPYVVRNILEDEFKEGQLRADDLRQIKTRTMIIWGSQDEIISPRYANVFAENIAGSSLIMINGARHTPHYTHAEKVASALLNFVRSQ